MTAPNLSPEEYRLLAEQSPAMLWRCDANAGMNYFSESWFGFTGRTFEKEKGDSWNAGVHPDDLKDFLGVFFPAFRKKQPFSTVFRLKAADGSYRSVLMAGVLLKSKEGKFLGYTGSCMDITDLTEEKPAALKEEAVPVKLEGLLAVCANCRRVKDDKNRWQKLEDYIRQHSEAFFSHGICPECLIKLYKKK
ncbi:MAG: PAS domain S-box protein [bacterium]